MEENGRAPVFYVCGWNASSSVLLMWSYLWVVTGGLVHLSLPVHYHHSHSPQLEENRFQGQFSIAYIYFFIIFLLLSNDPNIVDFFYHFRADRCANNTGVRRHHRIIKTPCSHHFLEFSFSSRSHVLTMFSLPTHAAYYFSSQVIIKIPFKISQENYIINLTQAPIFFNSSR